MIRQLPWVADGVARFETHAFKVMVYLAADRAPRAFPQVIEFPWVKDGLSFDEIRAVNAIRWSDASNADAVVTAILGKPWMQDDLDFHEATAVEALVSIAQHQSDPIANMILEMPFLETIEPVDALAALALSEWARLDDYPEYFDLIWHHPIVSDGITDEESRSVAHSLGIGDIADPRLITKLLDPKDVEVEQRIIQLPLTGEVSINIVHPRPIPQCRIDALEKELKLLEEFMSMPLPTADINFVYTRHTADFGYNAWSYIFTPAAFTSWRNCEQSSEFFVVDAMIGDIHEAAHFYWRGNQSWIDEGAAVLLGEIWDSTRRGQKNLVLAGTYPYCRVASIAALIAAEGDAHFSCPYRFGRGLFGDLYRNMETLAFRQSFRHLYVLSRHDDPDDQCEGTALNICHVRTAFTPYVPEQTLADVEKIIDKWFRGNVRR